MQQRLFEQNSVLNVACPQWQRPVEPVRLGERLRQARQAQGLTLAQAGARTGIARSTLSRIENEQLSPTFSVVSRLVQGLGLELPQLLEPARKPVSGRRTLTRQGEGRPHPTPTYEHELLATDFVGRRMVPFKSIIRARALSEFNGWVRHEGEEFLLVLSGSICLYTEHYVPLVLEAGDNAYFDSAMGHACVSLSEADAEVLWVVTR